MCSIFGTTINSRELMKSLGISGEDRGTDATGLGYSLETSVGYSKRAVKASNFNWFTPELDEDNHLMWIGHTRKTTQGDEGKVFNNHPFLSEDYGVLLTHNGTIYNDTTLKNKEGLPDTEIETDSYVILQLIENMCFMKKKTEIDIEIIKEVVEMLRGSFALSILTYDKLYLLRHKKPLNILYDRDNLVYASTTDMLEDGLKENNVDIHDFVVELNEDTIYEYDLKEKQFINTAEFTAKTYTKARSYKNYKNMSYNKKKEGSQCGSMAEEFGVEKCFMCGQKFDYSELEYNMMFQQMICEKCEESIAS